MNFFTKMPIFKTETINDFEEAKSLKHNTIKFYMGNKKVAFKNSVLKIYYYKDTPIDNTFTIKRCLNKFITTMKKNINKSRYV